MKPARSPETEIDLEAKLFPVMLSPMTADTLAQYQFLIGRLAPSGYGAALASAHHRALGVNEALAELLRSPEALADVADAAESTAQLVDRVPISVVRAQAAEAARAKYRRAIAEQLAAEPSHALAAVAKRYVAALDARAAAEAAERRQAELETAERERQEADALAAKRAERDRIAAEAKAAEEAQQTAEALVEKSRREYLAARARRLVAELEVCGFDTLKVREGASFFSRGRYSVADLIKTVPAMSMQQLVPIERALSDALEAAEDAGA